MILQEVRCPHCQKKLAEHLVGLGVFWCRKCDKMVRIQTAAVEALDKA